MRSTLPSSPSVFSSPSSCLTQDRRGQTSGAPPSNQTRSVHQRSPATSGGPSSARARWRSQTSPSTPSQWLSESREWPKASSETGAWRSDVWCQEGAARWSWRPWFIHSVWVVVEGQGWCFSSLSVNPRSVLPLACYFQPGQWYVYMHRVTWT